MKTNNRTLLAALGAVVLSAAPALSHAELVYFLVGTRHVYRVGTDEYAHVGERRKIEETYADAVADAKATYDKHIADGADPAKESDDFNGYLAQLANQRDQDLGALYANADYIRARHPELQIEGEGPYQLMAINFHMVGREYVFDNFCVYAPWPGYAVVGAPYGWAYGVVYDPFAFRHVYLGWHDRFYVAGGPAFFGFVGFGGPVSIGISIGFGGGFAIGGHAIGNFHEYHRPWGGFAHGGYGQWNAGSFGHGIPGGAHAGVIHGGPIGGYGHGKPSFIHGNPGGGHGYGAGPRPAFGAGRPSHGFGAARPAIGDRSTHGYGAVSHSSGRSSESHRPSGSPRGSASHNKDSGHGK